MTRAVGSRLRWWWRRVDRGRDPLRGATAVGTRSVVVGRPTVANDGRLVVGDDVVVDSLPVPTHFVVGSRGAVVVGDRVRIGFGAAIASSQLVAIGDDTIIGPYVSLSDTDFHVIGSREAAPVPRAVEIGRRVTIGSRVTIMAGTTIGDDAHVAAGSVVGGNVEPGARIAGVPARRVTAGAAPPPAGATDAVLRIIGRTLGLAGLPRLDDRLGDLPGWDSLGALRILLTIEDELGVRLSDDTLPGALAVVDLVDAVAVVARPAHGGSPPARTRATPAAIGAVVQAALDLAAPPAPGLDRSSIAAWDSLGALKVLLALEDQFDVRLDETAVAAARSIADLARLVAGSSVVRT